MRFFTKQETAEHRVKRNARGSGTQNEMKCACPDQRVESNLEIWIAA